MTSSMPRIGLSLSGGGYRATAFHLGTLKKLHELGILPRVDIISTISGGSITGACYCTAEKSFEAFYNELYQGLQTKNVVKGILLSYIGLRFLIVALVLLGSFYFLFNGHAWLFPVTWFVLFFCILKYQFWLFPISKRIETIYDHFFYHQKTLGDLSSKPLLVIGSTNLQTARPFVFCKRLMHDSTYQFMDDPVKFKPMQFPVARAVMASSCVPFAFTPVTVQKEFFVNPADAERVHPVLVDGGVYDNQGIHKVMQQGMFACDIVVTSDAGAGSSGEMSFRNTFSLLMETVNVFMSRIKKTQMVRNVYDNAATAGKEIAYFSLGWDVEHCIPGFITNLEKKQITQTVIDAHALKAEWVADPKKFRSAIAEHLETRTGYDAMIKPTDAEKQAARSVGTNLTPLPKTKLDGLIKQAEALTVLQVKLYCPTLLIATP